MPTRPLRSKSWETCAPLSGESHQRQQASKGEQEYWAEMKFWWPHAEAIIASLLAWTLTGDAKYARWHEMVHDWAYRVFRDRQSGEWFGYARRDGVISTTLKGNMWKGPYHIPRMQWYCS